MFGSSTLDVAIGLIFTFLVISLIASAVTEATASALSWRAETLLEGIKQLLNDPQMNGLALDIYNHALANPQSNGKAATPAELGAKPSYIGSKEFACALIDIIGLLPGADRQAQLKQIDDVVKDKQLSTLLNGIISRADGNLDRTRAEIAGWFDRGMDRVAGVYKRKTQLFSLFIGLACAVMLNIDTTKIAGALWDQPMVIKSLAPVPGGETALMALTQLQDLRLPFGWDQSARDEFLTNWNWLVEALGWLISAVATLFGAPFWFDSLQRFVQIRGAGSS
jgi:hypothetical protein